MQSKSHNNASRLNSVCMTTIRCYAGKTVASHRVHKGPDGCLEDLLPLPHKSPSQIIHRMERRSSGDALPELVLGVLEACSMGAMFELRDGQGSLLVD